MRTTCCREPIGRCSSPTPKRRDQLWTTRVWPGAVLLEGEIRGTWRRSHDVVTVEPWGRLSTPQRRAVEEEAGGLPLPGVEGGVTVRWDT